MITFNNKDISFNLAHKRLLKLWIKSVIQSFSYRAGDINYIFTNDEEILSVNKEFLSHDYYTDIITFDTSDYDFSTDKYTKKSINGDLFISVDTVKSNSDFYSTTFEDELHRVMIHGVLHLIGFDDLTDEQKVVMREQENCALDLLERLSNE